MSVWWMSYNPEKLALHLGNHFVNGFCDKRELISFLLQKISIAVLLLLDSDVNHFVGGPLGPKLTAQHLNFHDEIYVRFQN